MDITALQKTAKRCDQTDRPDCRYVDGTFASTAEAPARADPRPGARLRALDKLPTLRDDAAFRGWLYRIIINHHRNRSRRAFWKRLIPLVGNEVDDNRTHDETLGSVERARMALAQLPADQREAIVLHDIEGWAVGEIADLEGVSMSAIKSRLSRGRERLRDIYARRFGVRDQATSLVQGETP